MGSARTRGTSTLAKSRRRRLSRCGARALTPAACRPSLLRNRVQQVRELLLTRPGQRTLASIGITHTLCCSTASGRTRNILNHKSTGSGTQRSRRSPPRSEPSGSLLLGRGMRDPTWLRLLASRGAGGCISCARSASARRLCSCDLALVDLVPLRKLGESDPKATGKDSPNFRKS